MLSEYLIFYVACVNILFCSQKFLKIKYIGYISLPYLLLYSILNEIFWK